MKKWRLITGIILVVICLAWLGENHYLKRYFKANYSDRFRTARALAERHEYEKADKQFNELLACWKDESKTMSRLRPFFVSIDLPRAAEEYLAYDGYAEAWNKMGDHPDKKSIMERFKPLMEASGHLYRKLKLNRTIDPLRKLRSLYGLAAAEVQAGFVYLASEEGDYKKNAAEKLGDALDGYLEALKVYNSLSAGDKVKERQLALRIRRNIEFISRNFQGKPDQQDQAQDKKRHGLGDIVRKVPAKRQQPDKKVVTDKKVIMLDAGQTPPPNERK